MRQRSDRATSICHLLATMAVVAAAALLASPSTAAAQCEPGRTSGFDIPLQSDLTAEHFNSMLARVEYDQSRRRRAEQAKGDDEALGEDYFGMWFETNYMGEDLTVCDGRGGRLDFQQDTAVGIVYGAAVGETNERINLMADYRGQTLLPENPTNYGATQNEPEVEDSQLALVASWRHSGGWLGLQAGIMRDYRLEPVAEDESEADDEYVASQHFGASIPRLGTQARLTLNAREVERGGLDLQWYSLGDGPWIVDGDFTYYGWENIYALAGGVGLEWRHGPEEADEDDKQAHHLTSLRLTAGGGYPGVGFRRSELKLLHKREARRRPAEAPPITRHTWDASLYAKGTYFRSRLLQRRAGVDGRPGGALGVNKRFYIGGWSYWTFEAEASLQDPDYVRLFPDNSDGLYSVNLSVTGHIY
jgi:hypothetical protein